MMDKAERLRPYAAPGNVIETLRRYRSLNLPATLELTDLITAGVPEGNVSRTLVALKFLGLVNEANEPTDEWRRLCAATDEEYRAQLADLLRKAFAEVFSRVNPATDSQDRVRQAFQPYEPRSQHDRMVTFFLGMCLEAGIEPRDPPRRRSTKSQGEALGRNRQSTRIVQKPLLLPPPADSPLPTPERAAPVPHPPGDSKTIQLPGGFTMTVSLSGSLFQLRGKTRAFVFDILDRLDEFETENASADGDPYRQTETAPDHRPETVSAHT